MAKRGRQRKGRSEQQRQLRQRRAERAFIFDKDVSRCLATVDREDWEDAISMAGGNVSDAPAGCGIECIPKSAKVLWDKSAEEASSIYRRWLNRRKR